MLSETKIIEAIDTANINFIWCWDCFRKFRRHKVERNELFQFQVKLTGGIFHLDQTYRYIVSEKQRLIAGKRKYNPKWFALRMAKLDVYLRAVKEAIGIGRELGDGFAWLFYRNEPELLDAHAKEQRQLLLPPAVGGRGERAFLEQMQGMGGMFVLYHAITSYLRLGDVSFFDPSKGEICAIGELKTDHEGGNKYTITLGYVAGDPENVVFQGVEVSDEKREYRPLDEKIQKKLDRQMGQLSDAINKRMTYDDNPSFSSEGKFHFNVLDQLLKKSRVGNFLMAQAGPGLMLGAWRLRQRGSLGKRLLKSGGNIKKSMASLDRNMSAILSVDLSDNCIFVSSLASPEDGFPTMVWGGIPLLWWPLSDQQMHDLVFGQVIITTLFNPAQLWSILRSRGYDVKVNNRSRAIKVSKQVGKQSIELHNFSYFEKLVPNALLDEHAVADMIDAWTEQARAASGDQPMKVGIRPYVAAKRRPRRDNRPTTSSDLKSS